MMYEPLAFYSAFEDKTTMWLAESYEYSDDYKTLTIKTRPNVTWSDGEPFSADDVAYTFNQLVEVGRSGAMGRRRPAVPRYGGGHRRQHRRSSTSRCRRRGSSTSSPTSSTSASTSCPKHIFKDQDFATFTHFDIAKGWPVTTGPWRVVYSVTRAEGARPRRRLVGRRAGVAELPAPKRFVYLPDPGEQGLISGIIANQYDIDTGIQPASFATVFAGNDKVTTWTGQDSPFGNIDWWPHSLYVNNEVAPWSDKNVRWAHQLLPRPRPDHRHRLDGRQPPVDAVRARLPAAQAVRGGGPAT